jgi:hypothetical protein
MGEESVAQRLHDARSTGQEQPAGPYAVPGGEGAQYPRGIVFGINGERVHEDFMAYPVTKQTLYSDEVVGHRVHRIVGHRHAVDHDHLTPQQIVVK